MDKLDRTDRKILQLLQQDCRITIKELAEKLHLSNTPVYERVKSLKEVELLKTMLRYSIRRKLIEIWWFYLHIVN